MRAARAILASLALQGQAHAGGGAWDVSRPGVSADAIDPREAAATEFALGEDAYRTGDYERASQHFARAHTLSPHPATLYNLAMAQERAGDRVGAWNTYDRLARDALTPAERRDAVAARERIRPKVALLEIRARSSRAVCVDGEHVEVDTSIVFAMQPGAHELRVGDQVAVVELEAGETKAVALGAGLFEPTTRSSRAVVPLLVTTSVGAGVATGLGIAAATVDPSGPRRGLAGAAAAASGIALGTAIAALVVHTRPRRGARAGRDRPAAACPR